ncbi:DUF559 domain-containing protein [Caballeronia sp. LZ034LL]|uniref:DUF559 domain-containing protein n=1 Tax=Caballeronia sp. LZ034LL TaxID=3038567 RepID=UPI00285C0A73|nr:DUF559 domain-containing protein [Caballeronia sp. LZ034LL]MDR5835394.1 DUF559 domain-containing protein [Caballeronia sp. LZ034LL]
MSLFVRAKLLGLAEQHWERKNLNTREFADAFTRSSEECVALMADVIEEIRQRNLKLPIDLDSFAGWLAEATQRAISVCESPIEKAFAGGLLLAFLFRADRGLIVTDPLLNAEDDARQITEALRRRRRIECEWEQHIESHREDLRNVNPGMEAAYLAEHPLFERFEEYGAQLCDTGKLTKADYVLLFEHPIVSAGWLAWHAFLLSPQSVFPGLGADGKDARVDAYIWCPAQPKLRMIVECDGYEFHGPKANFIADRQRDRNLQRAGYDVYRFAGTELFNDMKKVADEAWLTAINLRFGGGEDEQL